MLARQARFVLAFFLILVVAGGFALTRLPVSLFPSMDFPRVSVSLEAGDRPADQMIVDVTRPAEEALRAIPGVRSIRSQTSRGSAEVSVTFDWGHDMTTAALQTEAEMARLAPSMPQGFLFGVRRMDPTIFPVLGYSVTSDRASLVALKTFAQFELRPLLAAVPGVAAVDVLGGREAEYQVLADPVRLGAHGLSVLDIEAALTADNVIVATGRLEDRSRLFLTVVDDGLASAEAIGSIVVQAAGGAAVRLDDVAEIRLGIAPEWTRVTADGKDAVLVNIRQSPGANSIGLTDAVKAVIDREKVGFPPGITLTPYYDQSDLVRAAAGSVRDAILIGTALAGLVLFAFLRSWRFVVVVAILLPASLAAAALLLFGLGASLNIMTLGGMAAAVGLVVDDIVVLLEHVTRRLAEGATSALEAAAEMRRPLIGSSAATIVVFTPLAFLGGVTGGFFKALAVTMAGALFFSGVFCLTVLPLLATRLARAEDARRADKANGWLRRLGQGYRRLMNPLLSRARTVALVLVLVGAGTGYFSARVTASGFMPQMDEGGFVLDYVAPPGLSLTETDRLVRQVESLVQATPEVESYSRRTGVQLGGGLTEANEGDFFVRLKPLPRRDIDAVMTDLRGRIADQVPGLEVELIQLMGDLIGDLTAVPQPIEVKLYGNDEGALAAAAAAVTSALEGISGVVEVAPSDRVAGDAITITPDRAIMALSGLDADTVARQVGDLVGGNPVSTVQQGDRSINIRVWTPQRLRDRVEAVEDMLVRAPDGALIPIERIADVTVDAGQAQKSREDLQPMTAVTGRLEGRDMGSAMKEVTSTVSALQLPAGVRIAYGGLYAEQQRSFRGLMAVFGAALTLSALLLTMLFRDLSAVAAILATVGLAVAGVFAGLALTATELNIAAMMGLTMVIGIIAELGVFYFAELQDEERDGSHIDVGLSRIRPILMSALIAILALSPLALKLGQGSALLAPMAVAIISGLLVGAPMVLIAMPLFHTALQRRARTKVPR